MLRWRQGRKVKLNVYEGARAICQCHDAADAEMIVIAYNHLCERTEETIRLVRGTGDLLDAVGGLDAFKKSMEKTFMDSKKRFPNKRRGVK